MANAPKKVAPAPAKGKPEEKKNLPAKALPAAKGGLPSALVGKMKADAGKGTSQTADDNIIPLVYILQPLSPMVNPRKPEYVEGAQAGMILLKGAENPLVDGEEGILVQPCYSYKAFVEWQPDRGGFVAQHMKLPEDAEEQPDPQDKNKKVVVMPKTGNLIIETRYRVVNIYQRDEETGLPVANARPLAYVIPFSSSGHTVAREWMFRMNQKQLEDGEIAPAFAAFYHLTIKEKSNKKGTWFVFDVADAGWVQTDEQYEHGKALYNAFASGEKTAEVFTGEEEQSGDEDEKPM